MNPLLEPLQVASAPNHGAHIVKLDGELDLFSVPQLERALVVAAARGRASEVLVDLERVTFIDCAAINILVAAAERLAREGIAFRVIRGEGQVEKLLSITGAGAKLDAAGQCRLA